MSDDSNTTAVTSVKTCATCALFVWATGPTGRRRPTEKGRCGFRIAWPEKWPDAFRYSLFGGRDQPTHPLPFPIWPDHDANTCIGWQPIPVREKRGKGGSGEQASLPLVVGETKGV